MDESSRAVRMFFDMAFDGILVADDNGHLLNANPAACALLDRDRDELCGMTVSEITGGKWAAEFDSTWRQFLAEGVLTGAYILRRRDGTLVDVEYRARANVLPGHHVCILRDITERNRVESEREELVRALDNERRWFAAVIEHSPIGIALLLGREPRSVTLNRRGEEILGMKLKEWGDVEMLLRRLSRANGAPMEASMASLERAYRGEVLSGGPFILERADGTHIHLLASVAPVKGDDGAVLGVVGTVDDVTAQRELERMREEWASVVAHDLRQPLTVILATAGHLGRIVEDAGQRAKIDRIRANAERLVRMTRDLSDLSLLDARRLKLSPTRTDLGRLLGQVAEDMAEEVRARLKLTIEPEIPMMEIDPERIQQVIENLLSNAIKYGAGDTPIEIAAGRRQGEVFVSVCNRGPGISAELMPRLFSRFQRAAGVSSKLEGLGLGLHISRGLVEAHGGHMAVDSVPDETTTFTFTLPLGARS